MYICKLVDTNVFVIFVLVPSKLLAITVNLTLQGMNETTFIDLKPILKQAIADANNVPVTSVDAAFIEMTKAISSDEDPSNLTLNDIRAVIKVTIKPMNIEEETNVLDNLNENTESFLSKIKTALAQHNVNVLSMSEVERTKGKFEIIFVFFSVQI